MMDFENFVASIVQEKFKQFDEDAADAREQQGIAQVGLGTRPMSDRPGLAKEDDEVKVEKLSSATRVLTDMSDYYQPDEFPTQEVRIDNAPRFSSINKATVLDILSANRDGLEKQGIIKMPMGMMRQPDPTLDIDGPQNRILDKLDLRPPEGSPQDIQYGLGAQKLGKVADDDTSIDVDRDAPAGEAQDNQPNVVEGITLDKIKIDFVDGYLEGHEGVKKHKSLEGGKDTAAYGIKNSLGLNRDDYESDADFAAAVALKHYKMAETKFKTPKVDRFGRSRDNSYVWDDLGEAGRYALTDLHFNAGTIGSSAKDGNAKDAITNTLNYIIMTAKDKKKVSLVSLAKRRALNWNKAADKLGLTKIDKIQQMPRSGGGTIMNYLDAEGSVVHKVSTSRIPVTLNTDGTYKVITTTREEEV